MTEHPAHDRLEAFAAGKLSDEEMDRIGQHVEECERCGDYIDELTSSIEPLAVQLAENLLRPSTPQPADAQQYQAGEDATPGMGVTQPLAHPSRAPQRAPWSAHELPVWFGRYRILRKIGEGGMGVVYLADDTQLERRVALKIPFFDNKADTKAVDRFYREAKAMATVLHPNLCPIYDVGENDGIHFLTMAFLEGHPLSDYLKKSRPQPNRQIATVIRKLALALQSAHEAGIVHRDLKPENVLIRKDHEPIVMDFGLAIDAARTRLTHYGALIGTPAYMSPEQIETEQDQVGPAADIYALGVILYQMICGKLPFQGSLREILNQIAEQAPPTPRQVRANVNSSLEAICLKAMARQIDRRYQSARLMADDLGRFLKGQVADALTEAGPQTGSEELTVECPLCAARLVVLSDQIGQPVRCESCQSWAVVERPVPVNRSHDQTTTETTDSADATLMLRASEAASNSPRRAVATAALRQAEAASQRGLVVPLNVKVQFWLDPQMWFRGMLLALGLQLEATLYDRMWIASAFGGALLLIGMSATGLVILRAASRGDPCVANWPPFQAAEWLRGATPIVSSTLIAFFAGWCLGQAVSFTSATVRSIAVPLACGISVATFFPILLLSALEAGTPIPVHSKAILRSVRHAPSRWGWFFAKSLGLVALSMLVWQVRKVGSLSGNFLAAATVTVAILYFSYLLGRLLAEIAPWCVSQTEANEA